MAPLRGFEVHKNYDDKVMFTFFIVANTQIMACDYYPGLESIPGQSSSLNIIHESEEDIRKWFELLSIDGKRGMELQETAWALLYASYIDKYGIVWQFSWNK